MRILNRDIPMGRGSHIPAAACVALFFIVLGVFLATTSCSRLERMPPLTRRIVVLDFKVPALMATNPRQVKGWWFGSRTIRQNREAGSIFADVLARQLLQLKYVEQHSRMDLKYYLGQKRKLLTDKFKGLKTEDYDNMLSEVSPVDYGAELGVDQVLTGKIVEAYTWQHNTIHAWSSYVKVQVDLYDMATGKVVWSRVFAGKRRFLAQLDVMEDIAAKVVRSLDKTYYKVQNKPM